MRVQVALPDDVLEAMERIIKRSGRSRSSVYADALRQFVERQGDETTAGLNAVLRQTELGDDEHFAFQVARRILEASD